MNVELKWVAKEKKTEKKRGETTTAKIMMLCEAFNYYVLSGARLGQVQPQSCSSIAILRNALQSICRVLEWSAACKLQYLHIELISIVVAFIVVVVVGNISILKCYEID